MLFTCPILSSSQPNQRYFQFSDATQHPILSKVMLIKSLLNRFELCVCRMLVREALML